MVQATALSAGKRMDCVGMLYYSAFMQQTGAVPVCMGFSQVREDPSHHHEPPASSKEASKAERQPTAVLGDPHSLQQAAAQPDHDFKMLCVGYSSFCPSATALPHCEGLEVVLHGSLGSHDDHHHQQQQGSGSKAATSEAAAQHHHQLQPQHEQQEAEGAASPSSIVARLVSKAAANVSLMQTALSNEGPVKLKPLPKDLDDLQARVMATLEKQGGRMQRGVERVANNAYASTVKPLAAILGLSGSSSSTAPNRSPK